MKITVYTQPDCPPCEITKKFLTEYGFTFELKDIQKNPSAKKELINKYQSFSTPTIVIDDTIIRGFEIDELKKTLNIE